MKLDPELVNALIGVFVSFLLGGLITLLFYFLAKEIGVM